MTAFIPYHQNKNIARYENAFGYLLSQIKFFRLNSDGSIRKTFEVPIDNWSGDKFLRRLKEHRDDDGALDTKFVDSFPRMVYQMNSMTYVPNRRLPRSKSHSFQGENGETQKYLPPVPYDLNFTLTIMTRSKHDAQAIAEQIMWAFDPSVTLTLTNFIPDDHVDVPVVLTGVSWEDSSEGSLLDDIRMVTFSMDFVMQASLFGPVGSILEDTMAGDTDIPYSQQGLIEKIHMDVHTDLDTFETNDLASFRYITTDDNIDIQEPEELPE